MAKQQNQKQAEQAKAPAPTWQSIKTGEPAKPEPLADAQAYLVELDKHRANVKTYRATVIADLKECREERWLHIMEDANLERQATPSATATAASTWISRLSSEFAKHFIGRVVKPLKLQQKIVGYEAVNASSQEADQLVASLVALSQRFPALFTSDIDLATIKDVVEHEAEAIAEQHVLANELAQLDTLAEQARHALIVLEQKFNTFTAYAADVPQKLQTEQAVVARRAAEIAVAIAHRRAA